MTENKGKNNRDEKYKNTRNQRILDKLHHGHKLKKKGKKKKKKKNLRNCSGVRLGQSAKCSALRG